MISKFIFASLFLTAAVQAAGTIDHLSVENDVIIFSTTETKSAAAPACAGAEQADNWSISLKTQTGRAMYTLITTAIAKDMAVAVSSAQDCADTGTIERAARIDLVAHSINETNSSGDVGSGATIYKGDGVTKVGTLVGVKDEERWFYVDNEASSKMKLLDNSVVKHGYIYFSEDSCTGTLMVPSTSETVSANAYHMEGLFFKVEAGTWARRSIRSKLSLDGICDADVRNLHMSLTVGFEHSVCGSRLCVVKED